MNLKLRLPVLLGIFMLGFVQCAGVKNAAGNASQKTPFLWENATLYFLLTDRFQNGNAANDVNFDRKLPSATLRGFMGGDLRGIIQKMDDGYFENLGVNAIWFTPIVEQVHDIVDEGTGATYGFHGYWAKDWTRLDPNFGTEADLAELVQKAHRKGIRVVLDAVINHTGPATAKDGVWPEEWVRTSPLCRFSDYSSTITCTLVKNLPDIKTESNRPVELPPALVEKWKKEGRLDREMAELDAFFQRTGYPRAPRFYIIKWLCDYIRKYGIDGYRCDTAKHIEETVWAELRKEADIAFADWKKSHPSEVLDQNPFYMVGEVYGYNISGARLYDFGDKKVDFFANGFNSLINFEIKYDAKGDYEKMFSKYSTLLNGPLRGNGVLNYLTSHDDGDPFDKLRERPLEAGTKLLLCPGTAQVYYGDETARPLDIPGTQGDATLRSFMNWNELRDNAGRKGYNISEVLAHWQKLGRFRRAHPSVGAGIHLQLSEKPYLFKRSYQGAGGYSDAVIVGLDWPAGKKEISVYGVFPEGAKLRDYYSGTSLVVREGKVVLDSGSGTVLLGL